MSDGTKCSVFFRHSLVLISKAPKITQHHTVISQCGYMLLTHHCTSNNRLEFQLQGLQGSGRCSVGALSTVALEHKSSGFDSALAFNPVLLPSQDQYDQIEKHTQSGIDLLELYIKFVKERTEIEQSYAKQLRCVFL